MRTPKEIVHEDANSIEFTMFDDEINKTARKIFDRTQFFMAPDGARDVIRQNINRELNKVLDREVRKLRREPKRFITLEDKIMTEEAWRALVPHESEAEVCPVPTYKQILDYVYETALKK